MNSVHLIDPSLHGFHFYKCTLHNSLVGVPCGPLAAPSNGHVNTSAGTSFGDIAMYSCIEGYMLNGTVERTCQDDGQWNGSKPSCESEIL